jgi:hypothetical protein
MAWRTAFFGIKKTPAKRPAGVKRGGNDFTLAACMKREKLSVTQLTFVQQTNRYFPADTR